MLQFGDQLDDPRLHGHVQGRRRFIGNDQTRARGECQGDQHALAHAARKLMRVAAKHCLAVGQMHFVKQLQGSFPSSAARQNAKTLEVFVDLCADRHHRIERRHRLLRDERDISAEQ